MNGNQSLKVLIMIVRTIDEVLGSDREVTAINGNWVSRRLLLDEDAMDSHSMKQL